MSTKRSDADQSDLATADMLTDYLVVLLPHLTSGERHSIFLKLTESYCTHCGANLPCFCTRDE